MTNTESDTITQVLYVNKDINDKINLKILKEYLYNNNMLPKASIDSTTIKNLLHSFDLKLDEDMLDISRTTHDYAKKFNKSIQHLNEGDKLYVIPHMLSSSDGYSFIGEAFIHFVTALSVYDMFPTETSANLANYANIIKGNYHICKTSDSIGLAKNMTKLRKVQRSYKQFCKDGATSYKGLIGCLYSQNGSEKIIDIMRFVNKTLITNNIIDFTGKDASNALFDITICIVSTVIGWMTCYVTLISMPNTCFKSI